MGETQKPEVRVGFRPYPHRYLMSLQVTHEVSNYYTCSRDRFFLSKARNKLLATTLCDRLAVIPPCSVCHAVTEARADSLL